MTSKEATISAGRVGTRFFWVVLAPREGFVLVDDALAEGFEPTSEDAWAAARSAAAELGVKFREDRAYCATGFYKYFRGTGRASIKSRQTEPESATFLGSPYLWTHSRGHSDMGHWYDDWRKHIVTRVTPKFVFILDDLGTLEGTPDKPRTLEGVKFEEYIRLDRAALERDGFAGAYYTTEGREDRIGELDAEARQAAVKQAEYREQVRIYWQNKDCVYCGGAADRFSMNNKHCCKGCYDTRISRMKGPLVNMADW